MICVCFLDGISMGLIHQASGLAGDPGRKARREKHVMTRAPAEGWEPTWPASRALANPEADPVLGLTGQQAGQGS